MDREKMAEEDRTFEGYIDSHAHLADEAFDSDRVDVIERARASGAAAIVCIGSGSGAEDIPGAASRSDADDCFGPAIAGPGDYIAAVAVERFVCEVRVGVDEPRATLVFLGHFLSIQRRVGPAM